VVSESLRLRKTNRAEKGFESFREERWRR